MSVSISTRSFVSSIHSLDFNTVKARLVQHLLGLGIKTSKIFKVALVAIKEGTAAAKQVFVPAPTWI
jgi:hypothetical protein